MEEQNQPSPGEKKDAAKNSSLHADAGSSSSSLTDNDSSEMSIGPGTSDQGFEPGAEDRDDEFRKNEFTNGEVILDKENLTHGTRPTHGLVEEGPGPDS